jgi:hypothetical protein
MSDINGLLGCIGANAVIVGMILARGSSKSTLYYL